MIVAHCVASDARPFARHKGGEVNESEGTRRKAQGREESKW